MRRALLLPLALAACARDHTAYPSLAPRPAEKLSFAEPETPAPELKPDPALDVEVAAAAGRLDQAARRFEEAAARLGRLVAAARGATAGSDPWVNAQTALGELDTIRAETSEVNTDIEQLAIARATALLPDYPALERLRARSGAELEQERALIARLGAGLAPA